MIIDKLKYKDIEFLSRQGYSDEKAFNEVIKGNTYESNELKIEKGDHWIDLGGNVGAFTILAISKGATVDVYEPDPYNCRMIEKNLKINNMQANIMQKAVVANNMKKMTMYVGRNKQTWRNSLYKNWGSSKFTIDCVHFSEVLNNKNLCCKMDIEGSEIEILEQMKIYPKKMCFEWSFDIDPCLIRYRKLVSKMEQNYNKVHANKFKTGCVKYTTWQKNWFPRCATVKCT